MASVTFLCDLYSIPKQGFASALPAAVLFEKGCHFCPVLWSGNFSVDFLELRATLKVSYLRSSSQHRAPSKSLSTTPIKPSNGFYFPAWEANKHSLSLPWSLALFKMQFQAERAPPVQCCPLLAWIWWHSNPTSARQTNISVASSCFISVI